MSAKLKEVFDRPAQGTEAEVALVETLVIMTGFLLLIQEQMSVEF